MNMYYCKLVNEGYRVKSFFINAESEEEALKDLKDGWHGSVKGKWIVERACED